MSDSDPKYLRVQLATDLPEADDALAVDVYGNNADGELVKVPAAAIRDASVAAAEDRASIVGAEAGATAGAAASQPLALGAVPSEIVIAGDTIAGTVGGVTVSTVIAGDVITSTYGPPISKTFVTTIIGDTITTVEG